MDPIGASPNWEWQGYENSFVEIDGRRLQSVPGGGHWGGGLFIGARDHARFGLLIARNGAWGGRSAALAGLDRPDARALADARQLRLSLVAEPRSRRPGPTCPQSAFSALGAGSNVIWVDPEHDLVVVLRWIDKAAFDGFIDRLLAALN